MMRAFLSAPIGLSGGAGADSLLVDGEEIVAVGGRDAIESMLPAGGEKVALGGGVIVPGFQDAHVHLHHHGRNAARPDLGRAANLAEARAELARYASDCGDDVLFGENFDEQDWPEKRIPTREELDRIESRRPLIARRVCGHIAAANGAALRRIPAGTAGVDRDSGRLEEDVVFQLEQTHFPPGGDARRRAILRGQKTAFALGITTVHEFDIPDVLRAYRALERDRSLHLRVRFFCWAPLREVAELRRSAGGEGNCRLAGGKVFTDGSIGGETAALLEPYRRGGAGELLKSAGDMEAIFREADAARLPLAIHAIGDRAIETVLEGRRWAGGAGDRRDDSGGRPVRRMEHMEVLTAERAAAAAELGFLFSMQPNFHGRWGRPGGLYEERLGTDRARALNRTGSWIRAGYPVAFGSDAMPMDPFYGVACAADHPETGERVSLACALRHYTETAEAFAPCGGAPAGRIEPGRRADFLWLDRSPGGEEPLRRDDLRMTVAGGKIVYER